MENWGGGKKKPWLPTGRNQGLKINKLINGVGVYNTQSATL